MDETKGTLPQGMLDVSLHIKVDYQTWQQLIAQADQNDRSLSAEVRRAIRLYLEAQ